MRNTKHTVSAIFIIIGSHVVYHRKIDGTSKAQIVSWGHRDVEKDELCVDATSMNLEFVRRFLSFSAAHRWIIRKMDVK